MNYCIRVVFLVALSFSTAFAATDVSVFDSRPEFAGSSGNNHSITTSLGITELKITERAERTVITGLDAAKKTVAKLELIHGRFVPTEYGPEFGRRIAQGRKLFVDVRGSVVTWETIGFTDTTGMPALPAELNQVATFLADQRVRSVLEKWRIGWAPNTARVVPKSPALPFAGYYGFGIFRQDCSGLLFCGSVRGVVINTCAGNVIPTYALRIGSVTADEDVVAQCCPSGPNGSVFAVKACSYNSNVTSCGIAPNACKACPGSPQPYATSCRIRARPAGGANVFVDSCVDGVPGGAGPQLTTAPPVEIWPPNGKMRSFTLADFVIAVDGCDNTIDVNANGIVTSITSSEPGTDQYDIQGANFQLRADRDGSGQGRVYEIQFTVSDASGNPSSGVAFVRVPHDQS